MEAMTALMIATVALTAFMGFLAYAQAQDPPEPEVSLTFLQRLSIEDGRISGFDEDYCETECAIRGYDSMAVIITAELPGGTVEIRAGGTSPGSSVTVESGTVHLPADDGSRVMAHYEVAVFWR